MPGKTLILSLGSSLLFAASFVSAANTAGCGKAPPKSGSTITLPNGRTALLYIPPSYDQNTASPFIMAFHGRGGTSAKIGHQTSYNVPAVNNEYVAAFPQGLDDPDGKSNWEGQAPHNGANDLAFLTTLLDTLSNELCLDDNRFYASGFSNGGGFTNSLACDPTVGGRFAAFGINSGAMYKGPVAQNIDGTGPTKDHGCDPGNALTPIYEVHGDADPVIPYGNSKPNTYPLQTWLRQWSAADRNDCTNPNNPTATQKDGFIIYSFDDACATRQYKIHGLTHEWWTPSTGQIGSTQLFMNLFAAHTLSSDQ